MKIILVTFAIVGFGLDGLVTLYNTFQFWPPSESPSGEPYADLHDITTHVHESTCYLAGSIAGAFVAIACCLPAKQPKIMPPPVQPPITGK